MIRKNTVAMFVIAMLLILPAGCAGNRKTSQDAGDGRISTMEEYNSRFNTMHISSGEAWELVSRDSGAIVLDVRSEESYSERHVSIAINVPFEDIAEYVEVNVPDKDRVIVCYCFCDDKGGSALSACNLLVDLGYTNSYYMEPDTEWEYAGTSVVEVDETGHNESRHIIISGREARELYDSNPGVILLDVRNQNEYDSGHIEGSILIPSAELEGRLDELPDKDAVIIVYCRAGTRSAAAYGVLAAAGYTNIYDMQSINNWPGDQ